MNDKQLDLNMLTANARRDVESFVVNSVKIKLIRKFEDMLEAPGKINLRKLFLIPIFSINEMTERVRGNAPELMTLYYKELFESLDEVGQKLT